METPEGFVHAFNDKNFVRKYKEEPNAFSGMEAFPSNPVSEFT